MLIKNNNFLFPLVLLWCTQVYGVEFQPQQLPAVGHQESILSVKKFAYYAIMSQSQQGVSLSLVDKMGGPSPYAGEAGKSDGRINEFLDRGKYKIRLLAAEQGKGKINLIARPYTELNQKAKRLVEFKWTNQSLGDFQQRSYWIHIEERKTVHLEAAGRYLSDLRLWHNGNWLLDKPAQIQTIEPRQGEPITLAHLVVDLNPGLYLLTAYGGPGQTWSKDSKARNFYLRYGIPKLSVAGRQYRTAGPLGIDRFRIPSESNFFQLELPESEPATLLVSDYNNSAPFQEYGNSEEITKKSRLPLVKIRSHSSGDHVVVVRREAGKPYILQHFRATNVYHFSKGGRYWLSPINAGHVDDVIPATSILVRNTHRPNFTAARSIELDRRSHYLGRFNLLQSLSLFLEIKQAGAYRFNHGKEGAKAEFQLEPFFLIPPRRYQRPGFKDSGHAWEVDAGYYVLSIRPRDKGKGILDLRIRGSSPETAKTLQHRWRYPTVNLGYDRYKIYLNQSDAEQGLVLRPYPIDMQQDLPVMMLRNESLSLEVSVTQKGTLYAKMEDGTLLPVTINGKTKKRHGLSSGNYQLKLYNNSGKNRFVNLRFEETAMLSNAPLPDISPELLAGLPKYPILSRRQSHFLDLGRQESRLFNIKVKQPGLYRLESSGLLSTQGFLRTRLLPSLNKHAMQSNGRNFLIQEYLRPGLYQIRLQTQGQTQGHLGLHLGYSPLRQGGELQLGETARHTLQSGEAMEFTFTVPEAASYRIRGLGLQRDFRMRLEDEGGWPLLTPGLKANLEQPLRKGIYRLVILPQALRSRLLTRVEKITSPSRFDGHGPHQLPLNRQIQHVWMESEQRKADEWRFRLKADADIKILLSPQMQATLEHSGDTKKINKPVWQDRLKAGDYVLKTKSRRPNNRLDYHLNVESQALLNGMQRLVHVPSEITIANGKEQLVELSSFGEQDVRASLLDGNGRVLAKNDDRQHDWNFLIQKKLPGGDYRLKLEGSGATLVRFQTPLARDKGVISLPATLHIKQTGVHNFLLPATKSDGLLFTKALSPHGVGLDVEVKHQDRWQSLGVRTDKFIAVPLQANRSYRLRAWSLRSYNVHIQLQGRLVPLTAIDETQAASRMTLKILSFDKKKFGVAAVNIKRHGVFHISHRDGVFWSNDQQSLRPMEQSTLAANKGKLWLISDNLSQDVFLNRMGLGDWKNISLILEKEDVHLDLARQQEQVIIARSLNGFPGLALSQQGKTRAAFHGSASLLYVPKSNSVPARLWAADGQRGLGVMLKHIELTATQPTTVKPGVWDINLPPLQSTQLRTQGIEHIQANLAAHSALVLIKDNQIDQTYWADESPRQFLLDIDRHKAILINLNNEKSQLQIIAYKSKSGLSRLSHSSPFARLSSASLSYLIPVESHQSQLQLWGDYFQAWFMDEQGRLQSGANLKIEGKGRLLVHGKPGWFMASLTQKNPKGIRGKRIKGNTSLKLRGKKQVLSFNLADPTLLHLQNRSPVLIEHNRNGEQQFYAYALGANLNLPLMGGEQQVTLHALDDQLKGYAQLRLSAVSKASEGLGKRLRLAPGQSRLFQFEVKRGGQIGIGVKADEDVLNCRVYDTQGKFLGQGVIQLLNLPAGRYFLSIEAAADLKNNIAFQTALVGIQRPANRAPLEVVKRYIELDEAEEE